MIAAARQLIGKHLCSKIDGHLASGMIVETEAYRAPDDRASHAYNNRRTKRTETMFASGGIAYIYLCYGIHHLFNVVTGPAETAHAVLIRAIEPVKGIDLMLERRKQKYKSPQLTAGPGKLTQALGITTAFDGTNLCNRNLIWIEQNDQEITNHEVISSARVGVDYAGTCAKRPWRFSIKDHPYCSNPKPQLEK